MYIRYLQSYLDLNNLVNSSVATTLIGSHNMLNILPLNKVFYMTRL